MTHPAPCMLCVYGCVWEMCVLFSSAEHELMCDQPCTARPSLSLAAAPGRQWGPLLACSPVLHPQIHLHHNKTAQSLTATPRCKWPSLPMLSVKHRLIEPRAVHKTLCWYFGLTPHCFYNNSSCVYNWVASSTKRYIHLIYCYYYYYYNILERHFVIGRLSVFWENLYPKQNSQYCCKPSCCQGHPIF